MRVITAFVLLAATANASSVASAASPPHPRLMVDSQQLAALREKFKQPRFVRFRQLLLADAEALMNYQGLHPQPGKDIGEGYRAYKLAAQERRARCMSCLGIFCWTPAITTVWLKITACRPSTV